MQISLSFPVAAAGLPDTNESCEFLGSQWPGKSSLQKVLGMFFPPEDGDQRACPSHAPLGTDSRSAPTGSQLPISASQGPQPEAAGTSCRVKMGARA